MVAVFRKLERFREDLNKLGKVQKYIQISSLGMYIEMGI